MKNFLSEVARLSISQEIDFSKVNPNYFGAFFEWKESDSYNGDDFPDWDTFEEDEIEFQMEISTIRKLALKYDQPNGRFQNNHLWYVYFDRYAYDDPRTVKNNVVAEEDLSTCLAILDLDNVFYFEAMVLSCYIDAFKDMSIKEILDRYYKKILHQCYGTGKFETPLWKIECNVVSARNK